MRAALLALAIGCAGTPPVVRTDGTIGLQQPPPERPPTILSADKVCDVDDSRWTFATTTDAWTNGGWVYLTVDGVYLEKHRMPSIAAAGDGTADSLWLELAVAVEWRDDEGTAFACSSDPAGRIEVLALDGTVSDCRYWGDPALFSGSTCEVAL